jgi:outer membrane receptor protein involved in Fe transport
MKAALVGAAVVALAGGAWADVPRVAVEDLPPLPAAPTDGAQTQLAVVAATAVEEDVVVGAAKREQSLGNVASAVTVLTSDRLRRFGYRTVAEALRGAAGIYVVDDHYTERVGVRGLQVLGDFNTRWLLLIDGATVNEPWNQFAGVGWDAPVAIDDIARIEVIRGPVSSVYGTNAFFGIINVVTRGATESPRAWGRIGGSPLGGQASAGFAVGDLDHQLRASVTAAGRLGDELTVPALGTIDREADRARSVAVSLVGVYAGAFAQLRAYQRHRGLPFAPYQSVVGDPDTTATDSLAMLEGGYTRELTSRLVATVRGYASAYRYRDALVLEDGSGTFTDIGDSRWAGVEARGRYALVGGDRLGLTAGAEVTLIDTESQAYYDATPDDVVMVPKAFSLQGLYAEVDARPLAWLALTAGVRADRNSILEDRVSPRAALFASSERYGAKLLYAEGFRNPSAYEGFFDDGIQFVANPAIGAETIRSFEAVVWARPRLGLTARASGFRWTADRLVEQDTVMVGTETRLQFANRGRLQSTGAEVEASYRDAEGWLGFVGGAVMKVEDGDGARAIGAPRWTASAGASSRLLLGRFHVSTEALAIGERTTRVEGELAPAHVTWNLTLYAPSLGGFDATVGVRNLLGTREQVPAPEDYDRPSELVPTLPGDGRELYARLGYRY